MRIELRPPERQLKTRSHSRPNSNVKVVVRGRPLLNGEQNEPCLVQMSDTEVTITPKEGNSRHQEPKTFAFDRCFNSIAETKGFAGQDDVYEHLGREFLDHSFKGYNACIFAYGQTGSGKSYTMLGCDEQPGLIPRICEDLFQRIADSHDSTVTVRMSFCEIYNEQIRDLLSSDTAGTKLRLRDSTDNGTYVEGLSEFTVKTVASVIKFLEQGMRARATAATKMNSHSSRSHAVFSLNIKQIRCTQDGSTEEKKSLLRLVDLAGSERAGATGATGDRLKEGTNINKSLVTLGRVISTLAESSGPTNKVVPYRESVLTRLLQDSLGGNSKTAMVACVSPICYDQTLSTLRYADQAKKITTKARVNQDVLSSTDADARIEKMERELNSLQQQLAHKDTDGHEVSKISATVRFYEDQAAVLETQCKALAAQNRAVKRHNQLLTSYLREVTDKGPRLAETRDATSLSDIESQYDSLLSEIGSTRTKLSERARHWNEVVAGY